MANHYLYRHIRIDKNEPFYIGIGTKGARFSEIETEYRRAYTRKRRNAVWNNIISKTDYDVEIILESDDYDFVKKKEIEFILLYGRIKRGKTGTLSNLTDGGDGNLGWVPSEKTKAKWREQRKKGSKSYLYLVGSKLSEERKKNQSEKMLEKWANGEIKRDYKKGVEHHFYGKKGVLNPNFGKKATEEVKKKLSEMRTGKDNGFAKKVINTKTGDVYGCAKELSEILKIKYSTLCSYLSGNRKNPTHYVWFDNYEGKEKEAEKIRDFKIKIKNTETGFVYYSIKEASDDCGIKYPTLYAKLKNNRTNNTKFIII